MKILYVYRSLSAGPSIRRVFEPIECIVSKTENSHNVVLPYNRMVDCWKNMRYIVPMLKSDTYDIIHITGDVYFMMIPLFLFRKKGKYKTVVTVHDLGHYTQQKHTVMHFFYYWLWIRPIKLADFVTFISKKSRDEFNRLIKINEDKQAVVYNPYKEDYVYTPSCVNRKYRILHIGTGANKNLENVAKALNGIPCHLRIIKKLSSKQVQLLRENNMDFSNAYDRSDEQMLEEYKQCDIVSFPSLYEGFGMPIIEGQAVGRVVVTSNREPMRTIAGDGAILVNPESVDDIKRGFQIAMNTPKQYIEKGLDNCKRFSSFTIANQYLEIYKTLFQKCNL